jgi:hypothetical protein
LAGAVRTSGFLERAATDQERICHGANPFTKAWDARKRKTIPVLRRSKGGGGKQNSGEIGKQGAPSRAR